MIYTYKHIPHPIEKFNTEIEFFFKQLFKYNPKKYDEGKLIRPNFLKLVNASPDRLKGSLEKLTLAYHSLNIKDKNILKSAFEKNRKISAACKDQRMHLIKYDEIANQSFKLLLKDFFTMLWEEYPQNQLIETKFGTVQSHFQSLTNPTHQKAFVCPFCGLQSLKPNSSIYRNAYDHFVPKSMYPFISIDFQNLFPICHECNSDEKKRADTLYKSGKRRKALHPYSKNYKSDKLSIAIALKETYNTQNLKTLLEFINWEYVIKFAGKDTPMLKTWDDIYQIKRRYKEYVLTYQKTWFEDILIKRYREDLQDGLTFVRFKQKLLRESKDQIQYPLGMLRFVYFNFLFAVPAFENKLKSIIQKKP